MGIISTIAGVVGGKVVDYFTGNVGNKVIDTVNDFLSPKDKLDKGASPEELMEAYYSKLSTEDRIKVSERFAELENEAERINVELQKVMANSDKANGGYRKWCHIIMSLSVAFTSSIYSCILYEYFKITEELPPSEYVVLVYMFPFLCILLTNGVSGRLISYFITILKPKEKSAGENTVDKVINTINKKR